MNEFPASSPDVQPATPAPGHIALRLPSSPPRVTHTILGLTIFVYLLQLASQFLTGYDLPIMFGAKAGELIREGQIWRLITPILLHGSLWHIGFNMYALFSFGTGLERRFGHFRFLVLYLLAGFAGNVLSFLLTSGVSVGSSTSIFGLIAAEGIFLYQNRKLFGEESKQAIGNVISVAAINLFIGFSSGGLIDNWGHIGGLLGGLIFAWFGGPLWQVEGIYPLLRLVDKREGREVVLGAAVVLICFGGLAILGMMSLIMPK
ncbi:MAG: rhomboid family intramembrane serine protease [Anaerolineaceae bacterium]|nr:MAG: rhomboid family intramembrane serine protease [Anaerolineaceae bacterium]